MSKKTRAFRVELTGNAKQKLASLSNREGTTEIAMLGALATWLTEQNIFIQSAVLRWHPSTKANDAPILILNELISRPIRARGQGNRG